jgi:hypothetical protein
MTDTRNDTIAHDTEEWLQAKKRVINRRDFFSHLVTFVVVNACFAFVWAVTGAGYFWPAWLIGVWGIGLVLHGWDAFFRRPVTDRDIEAELRRDR